MFLTQLTGIRTKVKISSISEKPSFSPLTIYPGTLTFNIIFFFFLLFRVVPGAYGGSQARGRNGATAAGLHHSHSNTGSKPRLRPTPQLTATPDP